MAIICINGKMEEVRFFFVGEDGVCIVTLPAMLKPPHASPHLVVQVVPAAVGRVAPVVSEAFYLHKSMI